MMSHKPRRDYFPKASRWGRNCPQIGLEIVLNRAINHKRSAVIGQKLLTYSFYEKYPTFQGKLPIFKVYRDQFNVSAMHY